MQKLAHRQLLDTGKKGGLKGAEMIQGVVLSAEEWCVRLRAGRGHRLIDSQDAGEWHAHCRPEAAAPDDHQALREGDQGGSGRQAELTLQAAYKS